MTRKQYLKERDLKRTLRGLDMECRLILMVMASARRPMTREEIISKVSRYKITIKKVDM